MLQSINKLFLIKSLQRLCFCGVFLSVINLVGCTALTGKSSYDAFIDGDAYPQKESTIRTTSMAKVKKSPAVKNDKKTGYSFLETDFGATSGKSSSSAIDKKNATENSEGIYPDINSEPAPSADEASEIVLEENEVRCLAENNPSFAYRKRVAVLPMELQNRQHAVDIPYVEREYSQVLTERLSEAGLLSIDASAYHRLQPYSQPSRIETPLSSDIIRDTASHLNAQFLVTGHLVDLSFDRTKTNAIDLMTGIKAWKKLGRQTYEGATGSYWRQYNVDISVYDGPSGALIKKKRYRGEANHFVNSQYNYGLDSNAFWQSDYGELVDEMLNQQTQLITRSLECLPMRAQVSRVDDEVIEINAGIDSMLMPGDRMRIFHREPAGRDPLGVPKHRWKYYGGVTIVGVFPLKSIAVLDEELAPDVIHLGDIVQAW